jgi:hypothetical protein
MDAPDEFENYYTADQLRELVTKLNLFCPDFSPWQETTARRSHEDLFGRDIKTGEIYYNRIAGPIVNCCDAL